MKRAKLETPIKLTSETDASRLVKRWKTLFYGANEIASSVDWSVTYAYYKPRPPREEEWNLFIKKLEALRKECKAFYGLVPAEKRKEIMTVMKRLANIEEEFKSYPFSDRLQFFLNRLEFFKKLLRTA
jgi:hypothetical protein